MGGGAGIKIEIEMEQFYIRRSRTDRCKFLVVEQPVITRWSALGYDDGMRNISGDLLRAEVVVQPITEDEAVWLIGYASLGALERRAAWVERGNEPKRTIWRGYVRGKWQATFPLSVEMDLEVESFGSAKATLILHPADPERFNRFWEDAFNFIAEAEDPSEPDAMSEEQVDELHWELCEQNYGFRHQKLEVA